MRAVGLGIAPSEFWAMTLPEFVLVAHEMQPPGEGDYAGGMTAEEIDAILEYDFDAKG